MCSAQVAMVICPDFLKKNKLPDTEKSHFRLDVPH